VTILAGKWRFNETSEQLTLAFPKLITASQLSLLLRFNYTLNEGLSGFYRSSYKGEPNLVPLLCAWYNVVTSLITCSRDAMTL